MKTVLFVALYIYIYIERERERERERARERCLICILCIYLLVLKSMILVQRMQGRKIQPGES